MISSRWLAAGAIAALAIGCGTTHKTTGGDDGVITNDPGDGDTGGWGTGSGSGSGGVAACVARGASGTVVSQVPIIGGKIVATDASGDVFYTEAQGIVKLDAAGNRVYAYPYGSVVAVDAAGNAYLAGSFTQAIDLGLGSIVPSGNIDVFVVKLSPRGKVLFARALGLCGDGVESIAVAADGRIAVSGSAMGTAILDADGKLIAQLFFDGHVAFDSKGNLYVAGMFAGSLQLDSAHVLQTSGASDHDGFLVKLDASLKYVSSIQLGDTTLPARVAGVGDVTTAQDQSIAAIAVGADDSVALLGEFHEEMDLFGQTLTLDPFFPSGEQNGMFVVKLDASGAVVFAQGGNPINAGLPLGGIAVDIDGNVIESSNVAGNARGPFAYPQLTKVDARGAFVFGLGNGTGTTGYGLGVATDACGNIFWADLESLLGGPNGPVEQAFLREVAR